MRSGRSRRQESISLELLVGIVIGLMVLSFLAGWFFGGRHALKKAEARMAAVTVAETVAAESAAAEAAAAEAPAAETKGPEAEAAETTAAETSAPETTAAETTAAETTAAETTAAETTAAETRAPETTAAETTAAETRAPETTAAETRAPETAPVETAAPETNAPETAAAETAAPETSAAPAEITAAVSAGPERKTTGDEEPGEAPTYLDTVIKTSSLNGVAAGTALSTSEVDTADPTKYNMILSIAEGDYTYSRMADRSLRSSEVPLADLRYVKVLHYDHDGEIRVGELVVHKDILDDVTAIFAELFEKKYPINSMYLIDNYFGGETASAARERSAERDNTTCFCGGAGTAEGFGNAIVLNPGEGASEDAAAAVFRAHGFTRNGNRYEKMQ